MSVRDGPPRPSRRKKARKPPPRWRKYLVQAELELPAPELQECDATDVAEPDGAAELPWWQSRVVVASLALACLALAGLAATAAWQASRERASAAAVRAELESATLRTVNSERTLRIAPNPRSWSTRADASIAWPDPPQLLELYLPVGYTRFPTFALVVDKVDQGRVMVVERMVPDSNRDLRLSLNSSALGPGEYRLRVQGYTWRGERVDVGWVRLGVEE